ncbi:MAG: methanogen output domain 1-containing protein [Kiloniellaceae bacterium]
MRKNRFDGADIPFDDVSFTRRLLLELTDVLQGVIGYQEARGFIAVVGARIGDAFNAAYRKAAGERPLGRAEAADAMVDLKRRIGGDFYVLEQSDEEILFGNRRCPFGAAVEGRPALCMMTSNVFGRIAAENLGYAKVSVEEAFASGDGRCIVRVMLQDCERREEVPGREYFRVGPEQEQQSAERAAMEL